MRSNDDEVESQDFFSDKQSHISATLLGIWFSLPRYGNLLGLKPETSKL